MDLITKVFLINMVVFSLALLIDSKVKFVVGGSVFCDFIFCPWGIASIISAPTYYVYGMCMLRDMCAL